MAGGVFARRALPTAPLSAGQAAAIDDTDADFRCSSCTPGDAGCEVEAIANFFVLGRVESHPHRSGAGTGSTGLSPRLVASGGHEKKF